MGQKSCEMIKAILELHYERVEINLINDLYDLDQLVAKQPDLVFLGIKLLPNGKNSLHKPLSKVWVSAYLDSKGINYTGSNAQAIALDFNKPNAKKLVKAAGLNTSEYFIARHGQYHSMFMLPFSFPMFIKPPNTGGGKGIGADSVVRNLPAFKRKIQSIANDFQSCALVEKYLSGREFSVAILEMIESDELLAMPVELVTDQNEQGDRILGQKVKKDDAEHVIAIKEPILKQAVVDLAINVFKLLEARDYGRIDIRLDENGVPHFLEANLIPGVAMHNFTSYFTAACWINQSMNYENMILRIVELGLAHHRKESDIHSVLPTINITLPSQPNVVAV